MANTCQICGREIKVVRGRLAHHGYQRPGDGWQTASCQGARFKPYEESRDRIASVIEWLTDLIAKTEAAKKAHVDTPPAKLAYYNRRDPWKKPEWHDKPEDWNEGSMIGAMGVIGRPSPNSYAGCWRFVRQTQESDLAGMRESKKRLERRYAEWPEYVRLLKAEAAQ